MPVATTSFMSLDVNGVLLAGLRHTSKGILHELGKVLAVSSGIVEVASGKGQPGLLECYKACPQDRQKWLNRRRYSSYPPTSVRALPVTVRDTTTRQYGTLSTKFPELALSRGRAILFGGTGSLTLCTQTSTHSIGGIMYLWYKICQL